MRTSFNQMCLIGYNHLAVDLLHLHRQPFFTINADILKLAVHLVYLVAMNEINLLFCIVHCFVR